MNPDSAPARSSFPNLVKDQRLGYGLIAAALLVVLSALNDGVAAFLWLALIALGFLVAYRRTGNHGLVVPGGVFAGIAAGALLEGITPFNGIFLLGFAGGFWLIRSLEPERHTWAQYPAWVFTGLAALVFLTENAWLVALALVIAGFYLLRRQERRTDTQTIEVAAAPEPVQPSPLERLRAWRFETAQRAALPEAEILRTEQLERLAAMRPENVDAMFGILDAAQIEKHGKALLAILRA